MVWVWKKFTKTKNAAVPKTLHEDDVYLFFFLHIFVSSIENSLQKTKLLMQCVMGTLWKSCEEV